MKTRTLVTDRRYYGLDPVTLCTGAARVLSRVAGLPPERARVRPHALRQDFGLDTREGLALAHDLVAGGVLERDAASSDFLVTPQLAAIAQARIVEPLPRARAKLLIARACEVAADVNRVWTRNPLEVAQLVPHGAYMTGEARLDDLALGLVVRLRPVPRRARWNVMPKAEGARGLRTTFGQLSTFIRVRLATELEAIPRPFCVAWQADDDG